MKDYSDESYYYNLYDDISWDLNSPKYDSREKFKKALEDLGFNKNGELFEYLDIKEIEVIYSISQETNDSGVWEEKNTNFLIKSNEDLTEFEILFQIQLNLNNESHLLNSDKHYFEGLYLIEESIGKETLQYQVFLGS